MLKRPFLLKARLEFLFLAFKYCAFRQRFLLRNIYYQDLMPDFHFKDEIPKLIEKWDNAEARDLQNLSFAPFGIKIGSTVDQLFSSLGKPSFMDSSSYRTQRCYELQYRTKVGKLKCKISFLVASFRVQLILLQIAGDPDKEVADNPVDLLLGHEIGPNQRLNEFYRVGSNILQIEQNSFRSQFLITNSKLSSIRKFKQISKPKANLRIPCQRVEWYRRTFGTLDEVEI